MKESTKIARDANALECFGSDLVRPNGARRADVLRCHERRAQAPVFEASGSGRGSLGVPAGLVELGSHAQRDEGTIQPGRVRFSVANGVLPRPNGRQRR